MKKKVLFIGSFKLPNNGQYGGVYQASTSLLNALEKHNVEIIKIDTTLADIKNTKIFQRLPSLIIRQFKFVYKCLKYQSYRNIIIFLSGGNSYVDKFFTIILSKLLGRKILLFPRSGYLVEHSQLFKYSFFIKVTCSLSDIIFCQSEYWRDFFQKFKNIDSKKLIGLENWISIDTFRESQHLQIPVLKDKQEFKLVFVSRIEKAKGIDDILKLADLIKKENQITIDIYGDGAYKDEMISHIKENNLSGVIKYCGWLKKDVLLQTINQYHLAIFPSKLEGYPNSLLDFIFAKVPIIAKDIPMVKAVGTNNIYYYSSIKELADNVLEIRGDYEKARLKSHRIYIEKSNDNLIEKAAITIFDNLK